VTLRDFVKKLQNAMNRSGSKLVEDGQFGSLTLKESEFYDFHISAHLKKVEDYPKTPPDNDLVHRENPAYLEAKKYSGKTETDKTFGAWLSSFWGRVGLPGYKTIIGSAFAWCGLFLFAMNTQVGQKAIVGAAGARNWAKYGVEIDWKKDGIPRGSVVHLNNGGNCSSGSGNHVTFADGDCTAAELAKPGARVPGFGGNQGDTVKRSIYSAAKVCAVRWPAEIPKPPPVKASRGCTGGSSSGESTR